MVSTCNKKWSDTEAQLTQIRPIEEGINIIPSKHNYRVEQTANISTFMPSVS